MHLPSALARRPMLCLVILGLSHGVSTAQETPVRVSEQAPDRPTLTPLAPGVWRSNGREANSGITYARFLLIRSTALADVPAAESTVVPPDLNQPTLTGQCTRDARNKLYFELFANFGGQPDGAFYPPWRPRDARDLFPPRTSKIQVTLEFIGYTKVKPYKRQFEQVEAPGPAQLRYTNPGHGSSNLEPPGWFFQYLRALPVLRLSDLKHSADFFTSDWLAQLHAEPLCGASGA